MEDQSQQAWPDDNKPSVQTQALTDDVPILGHDARHSAPVPEPPLIHGLEKEKLRVKYDKQGQRSLELQALIQNAQSELKTLVHEMATVAHLFEKPVDPQQNQKNIRAYIDSQNKMRIDRAAKRHEILQGMKLEELLPPAGSKLDQVMSRKKGLGQVRPAPRPLMTTPAAAE